ncbi:MAG: hypothetical protein IPO92_13570 [Saprospiraceae bacterium]|nr:hypothetical protein [Saprospiraceae bacterium]
MFTSWQGFSQSSINITTYPNVNNLCYKVSFKEVIKISNTVHIQTLTFSDKLKFTEKSYTQEHHQYLKDFFYPNHDIKYKNWNNIFPKWYTVADLIRTDETGVTSYYVTNSPYLPGGWVGHTAPNTKTGYYGIDTRLGTYSRYYKEDHNDAKLLYYNGSLSTFQNFGFLSKFIFEVPTATLLAQMTQQGIYVEQTLSYIKISQPNIRITWKLNEKTIIKEFLKNSSVVNTIITKYTLDPYFQQYLKKSELGIQPLVFENGDCYDNLTEFLFSDYSDVCTTEAVLPQSEQRSNVSEIKVFPNPAQNEISITYPMDDLTGTIKIYSTAFLMSSNVLNPKSSHFIT